MPAHPARLDAGDGERGSVAMALIVIVVATVMVVALLVTTQIGLRSARRAGDSANALQLADAGINDAAKAITAHTGGFSGGSSLGTAGSYAYCATSPGMGVVGSNGSITFTGGTGASNCRGAFGWDYAADGCAFFGQSTIPPDAKGNDPIGNGACPPAPDTAAYPDKYLPPSVTVPAGLTSEGAFSCTGGTISSGTHLYSSITLSGDCRVGGSAAAAVLYVTGPVTIGTDTGNCKSVVNRPPAATCTSGGYQSGWPAVLQINVAGNGTVTFANHAVFWGVINAPNSVVTANGGGTPQVEIFGSVLANSAGAAAQFQFHYDQALRSSLTTGQYRVTNWREEASG